MLSKSQIEKYADVLLWGLSTARSEKFKKGDLVSVRFDMAALTLAEAVHRKLLERGLNPLVRMLPTPAMETNFLKIGDDGQITFRVPGSDRLFGAFNGSIYISAPDSLTHLKNVDPARISMSIKSRKYLKDILERREEGGKFGWTLCTFPTAELASQAGISIKEYTRQVVKACYLDSKDPVAQWKDTFRMAGEIKRWLNRMKVEYYHVESDGVDMIITPGQSRRWIGVSGHNIPSFELFMSPDWRGTQGVYYADQPSFRSGNYVEGIRLEFKDGKVVKSGARRGAKFLGTQIDMDTGARRVGEFSLTDTRFSRINRFMADTLYDENFGGKSGNCHIALGASYSDTFSGDIKKLTKAKKKALGFNDSSLHWDMVNTENKVVTAHLKGGGKVVIYKGGKFTC